MPKLIDLPEISFIEGIDIETLLADNISSFEDAYLEQTGEQKILAPGDPIRIWIYTMTLIIYQLYQNQDFTGKMNLLKYSQGAYLDNLASRNGVTRLSASKSVTTLQFTLSAIQATPVTIPIGTRATPGNNIFFETTETFEITAGDLIGSVLAQSTVSGTESNGFTSGQINVIVDPIQFVQSVTNTDTSQGGADIESDDSLRERVFTAPESFSVAGPSGAYEFWVKSVSSTILDVYVSSPSAGEVDIRFILSNGELPDAGLIASVESALGDDVRPLTDSVTVQAPTTVNYDIDITYYISNDNANNVSTIQSAVTQAVSDFEIWQKSKIGRDVNPDELVKRLLDAGAKRVSITNPSFTTILATELAILNTKSVTYGGLESN